MFYKDPYNNWRSKFCAIIDDQMKTHLDVYKI